MREKKAEETRVPDIVAIEAVDENVAAEVEKVNGGSGNRHFRSTFIGRSIGDSQIRWFRRGSVAEGDVADLVDWIRSDTGKGNG